MNTVALLAAGPVHHWAGPWFLLFPLFWAAVITAVVLVRRRLLGGRHRPFPPFDRFDRFGRGPEGGAPHPEPGTEHLTAAQLLDRRYAEGRISTEDYRERRATIDEMTEEAAPGKPGL